MTEHLHELDLLALADGELDRPRRREVEEHLASCPECAASLAQLEAGRDALRGAEVLRLPPERREAIRGALPVAGPDRIRRFTVPHRRLAMILAAAVVGVGVAAGIVVTDIQGPDFGGGGSDNAATGAAAGQADTSEGGSEAVPSSGSATLASVQGPAEAVAAELRQRGYDARVENGDVHIRVTEGVPPVLLNFLETLPTGPVAVIAETP
jgi:predicted anti-sigma-YlaC factor YlaD